MGIRMSNKVRDFVDQVAPLAIEIGAKYGIDPKLIIAQTALETGWGSSVAGNNYFGVKGKGQKVRTQEQGPGANYGVIDDFRVYDGLRSSMEDYARLIGTNPRYAAVPKANSLNGQIQAVFDAGYATDDNSDGDGGYVGKLKAVSGMIGDLSKYRQAPTPATINAGLRDGTALDAIAGMAGGTAATAYAPAGMALPQLTPNVNADVPLPRRRPSGSDRMMNDTFDSLGNTLSGADGLALNPVTGAAPTGFDAGLGFFSNGQPAMGMLPERANSLGMTAGIDPTFTLPQYPDPASMSDDMRLMRSANAQGLPPLPPLTGEKPATVATGYDAWLSGGALPGAGPSTRTVASVPIDPLTRLPMNTETQQAADTSRWGSQFMRNDRLPTGTPGATAMDPVFGGIPPQVVASSGFKHAGEGADPLVGLPPFPAPYGVAEGARNRYASNNLYGTGGVDIDPGMIPPVPQRFGMGDLARIAAPNRQAVADRVDGMRAGMVPTNLPGRASTSQSNGLMGTLASLFGGGPKTGVATMQDIQRPNPSQQYGLAGAGLFRTPAFGNALASALSAATPGGANLSNFAIGTNGYAYERNKDGSYDRAGRPSSNGSSYGSLINRLTA